MNFKDIKAQSKQKLHEGLQPLHQRWQALEQRERRLLSVLGVFLLLVFLWLGVWQPVQQSVENAERRLDAQRNTLALVERHTQRIHAAREQQGSGPSEVISSAQLSGYLNTLTQQLELEVTRIQPQNESRVMVFNEANFDAVIDMVAQLVSRGVIIEHLDISETNDAGVVRVRRLQVRAST